jgi:hypothetical protein
MINAGDADVLSRYVALLEGQVRARAGQDQPHPNTHAAKLAFA